MPEPKKELDPKPGDWVLIRAEVLDEPTRPEDVMVQLRSKSEQYPVVVRRDLVVDIIPAPLPDEPDEKAVVLVGEHAYQRLAGLWYRAGSRDAYPWAGLCQLGVPQVVVWP